MTNLPDDLIDPAEGTLIRRVRSLAEPAVVPIDPVAIAASVAAARPRGGPAARLAGAGRLGWLLAGAALTAVLVGGVIGVGAFNKPAQGNLPPTSINPTPVPGALAACDPGDLTAGILGWDGAAGHRIATVRLASTGADACSVPQTIQLSLVDASGTTLISGITTTYPAVSIAPNDVLHTMVQVGNYCGPAAQDPATIVFDFGPGAGRVTATPASSGVVGLPQGLSGIPPCLGINGPRDDITMQGWAN